jgi:guanylate kinase
MAAMPGVLFIVSAASGAGKTTLVNGLLQWDRQVRLSISYTTRAPRPGEQHGREYHFTDVAQFTAMRERGEFIEWAHVHGNYYGTSRVWLEEQLGAGHDVMLEIDWQGARQVRKLFADAVSIFVLPPSPGELERRLRRRGQDSAEVIARRLSAACDEMRHVSEFDYVIINKELDDALAELQAVVQAARLRYAVQSRRHPHLFQSIEQD